MPIGGSSFPDEGPLGGVTYRKLAPEWAAIATTGTSSTRMKAATASRDVSVRFRTVNDRREIHQRDLGIVDHDLTIE
jgi:hypothetical protein